MKKEKIKKDEKKKQKQLDKRMKKLKSTLEWMDVESVNPDGIYLQHSNKKAIVRGLRLLPINLYLLTDSERTDRIIRFASAIDKLYQFELYFKFIKIEPDTTMQTSQYMNSLEMENNPAVGKIIELQIDKLEWFRTYNREVKFYVMVKDDELHIDKTFDILRREFSYAWGSSDLIKPMSYMDYKAVIQQEFENDHVDEYLFTQAILPEVNPIELNSIHNGGEQDA